tara:strand:+ start:12388 stop:13080 length:693 start_codon:yes stop_codon:yes gene_type:complete
MSSKDQRFKNNLRNSDRDGLDNFLKESSVETDHRPSSNDNFVSRVLLIAVIVVLGLYFVKDVSNSVYNPLSAVVSTFQSVGGPSEDLLNSMNELMIEMGYTDLTHDDLRALRSEGVTATFISNIRALGFTEITLDEAVSLANADVSTTFMAMMIELGYDLTLDEFAQLRRANVTAHYTSNVHDLGFRDVTKEQLIRMRTIGVTTSLIEQLQQENPEITMEEIIRYRISNQ